MRLLADTHILLWLLAGSSCIRPDLMQTLAEPSNAVYVSAASIWEIAIKVRLGRLAVPPVLHEWLPEEIDAAGLTVLPIQMEHALGVERLPRHHSDPFDRILISQAHADGLTLVSADQVFTQYDVPLIVG